MKTRWSSDCTDSLHAPGVKSTAIGIGHAKPNTLHALQRMLPELAEQGFVFVLAEEAVKEVGSER